MKALILVAHPDLNHSLIHKRWIREIQKETDNFTLHDIYAEYPDWNINVKREQNLIESHDELVIQFPCFWFSCPPLLKKWQDEVITRGWAFNGGKAFVNRRVRLAVSAGMRASSYSRQGIMACTLEELLLPYQCVCRFIQAKYDGFHAFYGTQDDADDHEYRDKLEENTRQYLHFLNN
ncbi:NAD(P)H-dependent oxidoreductase [Martelella alba]|uniref:NAD(P)H-dependent oxidoreductase n=1 Tax=Martelella alba TaxID=2590451 RepID=A0ABY2SNH1_9HYPH|nr:NAD(P)H-dependent oxidoreductase [Martelella alba]TKI06988.1 NAD(P)H-dependent oxidoreductase [Martelella alba]